MNFVAENKAIVTRDGRDARVRSPLGKLILEGFQTIITTTHINTFNHDWIKDSQILAVEAGKISEVLWN